MEKETKKADPEKLKELLISNHPEDWELASNMIDSIKDFDEEYLQQVCKALNGIPVFDPQKYEQALNQKYADAINKLRELCDKRNFSK